MVAAETPDARASSPIRSISSLVVAGFAIFVKRVALTRALASAPRLRLRSTLAYRSCEELLLRLRCVEAFGGPRFLQRLDLLGRVARVGQHIHRVLPERRRRAVHLRRRPRELDREAELSHLAELRLLVGDHHLALAYKRGLERLVEVEDRLDHRVVLVVERAPLLARLGLEDLGDLAMSVGIGLLELMLDQVLTPDPLAEAGPELRLERPAGDPAILGLVGAVTDDPSGQHHLAAPGDLAGAEVAPGLHRQPGQRAVRHRDVDHLALAAPAGLVQRGEDPGRGHQRAAAQVGDLRAGLDRRPARVPAQAEDSVQAEVVQVMAGAVAVRTVLAVAGDRAVDQRRIRLAQHLVADAQPLEHARPEALDQHVGGFGELQESLPSPLLLQVEPDRALIAVQRQVDRRAGAEPGVLVAAVVGRGPADVVALAGVLDLDHVSAEIGEEQGAEAAREQPGEVEDLDVRERQGAHSAAPDVSIGCTSISRRVGSSRLGMPSISRASATVAARRPTSSAIWRALEISSPFDFAISPFGR